MMVGGELIMSCYILYAAGYDETIAEEAKAWLEKAGIQVSFLGLKSGFTRGGSGGGQIADILLSNLIHKEGKRPLPNGLLLAGGVACGRQLLTDPRVHLLLQQMSQAAKPLGFLQPVSYLFISFLQQQIKTDTFLLQENLPLDQFMSTFLSQLLAATPPTKPMLSWSPK